MLSVEFFDKIARVDDPVGAVSVHFANGVWGTIAVGLFSTGSNTAHAGLFYGGGLAQLGTQLLGLICVDAYVLVVMFIIFKIIDKTLGLRVPAEVEIDGLDIHEHGLASAYAGFAISDANSAAMTPNENTDLGEDDVTKASATQMDAAVPVVREPVIHDGVYDTGMHKVSIIAKLAKFDQLKTALNDLGVTGMTVTQVMGCGIQKGTPEKYRGVPVDTTLLPKIKVEVIVSRISVDAVVEAAKKALYTGHIGDGKIFVYNVTRVVKIRTGEEELRRAAGCGVTLHKILRCSRCGGSQAAPTQFPPPGVTDRSFSFFLFLFLFESTVSQKPRSCAQGSGAFAMKKVPRKRRQAFPGHLSFIPYRLRVRISVVTLVMKSSRLISVVSPLRSRTEMLPASASLAPSTSI